MARTTKGRIYRVGDSPNYFAEYRIEGKRFRQLLRDKDGKPVTDPKGAEELLADILNPLNLHDQAKRARQLAAAVTTIEEKVEQAEEIANPPLTTADTWGVYVANPDRPDSGESTLENYHRQWRQFKAWLDALPKKVRYLCDVTPDLAKRYAASLTTAKASPSTYNKHVGFLELLFRILEKEENARIKKNPFTSIARKKLKTNSRRALTKAELEKIVGAAEGDFQLLLVLGIYSGLRMGDCCTLEWANIDMEHRIISRIPRKTASRRDVPVKLGISDPLYSMIASTPPQARRGYLLPELAKAYLTHTSRVTIVRRVQSHLEACGIETHAPGTGEGTGRRAVVKAGFHSLRYSYVQLQAEIGTSPLVVQKQVGHANPQMTLSYSDVSESAALTAAAGMTRLLGQGATDSDGAERQRLAGLAMTADIEKVKRALAILEGEK